MIAPICASARPPRSRIWAGAPGRVLRARGRPAGPGAAGRRCERRAGRSGERCRACARRSASRGTRPCLAGRGTPRHRRPLGAALVRGGRGEHRLRPPGRRIRACPTMPAASPTAAGPITSGWRGLASRPDRQPHPMEPTPSLAHSLSTSTPCSAHSWRVQHLTPSMRLPGHGSIRMQYRVSAARTGATCRRGGLGLSPTLAAAAIIPNARTISLCAMPFLLDGNAGDPERGSLRACFDRK